MKGWQILGPEKALHVHLQPLQGQNCVEESMYKSIQGPNPRHAVKSWN